MADEMIDMSREWCDFHPGRAWVILAWNIGMQGREWLCKDCYEQRTAGEGQHYQYRIERDRDQEDAQIRDETLAFAQEHPDEHQRLVEQGMQVVNQLLAAPAQPNEPRAIIRHFAAAMEAKLAANDGVKGGWRAATTQADMRRWKALRHLKALREEVDELEDALIRMASLRREADAEQVQNILLEAADVANYAMLIADVVGALPPTDERGRAVKEP